MPFSYRRCRLWRVELSRTMGRSSESWKAPVKIPGVMQALPPIVTKKASRAAEWSPGLFPWIMRRMERAPALFDGFAELLVRLRVFDTPLPQEGDQVIRCVSFAQDR